MAVSRLEGVPQEYSQNSLRDIRSKLHSNIQSYIAMFDSSVPDLQEQINKLTETTDDVERFHHGTTIGSLSGAVIGATGGIASIVGLILAPFTFGGSLIVAGVGAGVAALGGLTGAASNITNVIHQRASRTAIEEIIHKFMEKINPLIESLNMIKENIEEIQVYSTQFQEFQAGIETTASVVETVNLMRLVQVARIGTVAAQLSKTLRVFGAVTEGLSALFIVLDIYFIVEDSIEIHAMNQQKTEVSEYKSITLKFIHEMRKTEKQFQQTLNELRQVRDDTERELCVAS
ncbi:apolipoprotein L4-like [Myxocyprinus asiaticus]|uniref:apolipoprotein L4-like n=1 Tax=Myxocyprinus asiaticus TaxID=70543 RepID=UPI002221D744|nr:apolipoprotein L4-like [Myxocyprinus asiaticus]